MRKKISLLVVTVSLLGLTGCYQAHADDDLRAVPVTNNPNIVPRTDGISTLLAMP
jgi:hypothetical protein